MTFRSQHTTAYRYHEPVSICHNEVHLRPRAGAHQSVLWSDLSVDPAPEHTVSRKDYFGNDVAYFAIHEPHQTLTITAVSVVEVLAFNPPAEAPEWEEVRDSVREHGGAGTLEAFQYVFDSPFAKTGAHFAEFARPSFPARRSVLEGAVDLRRRIHREFRYAPQATTISTTTDEVLAARQGVCQDFAHVMIAVLRSIGLPVRYVSGYLRSGPKTVGAEASHAWVSVYCGDDGWIDMDPTNDVNPREGHITLAWGRDYGDVTPVRGVALGGGEQEVSVTVRVTPETV